MNDSQTSPIRIAQIVGKATMSGVDSVVMNYYRHVDREKVQFDFFMDGLEQSPIDNEITALGGRIFKLPPYEKSIKTNLKSFRQILSKERYTIVHCHMNALSVFWLREAKRMGVPVRIAHSHSTANFSEGFRSIIKYMLKPLSRLYPTHFFACSEYAGKWLFGKKIINLKKLYLMYNAIDVEKFIFKPNVRLIMRENLEISDKLVVGHVGRFMYQKNHDFLIHVFKEIYSIEPNSVLLLVGDGELRENIEDFASNTGLDKAIIFLGTRCDVHELMQAMDVFVFPSHYEGLGMVIIEAQASGLPCILSDSIPKEAVITNLCTSLSLRDNPKIWARNILNNAMNMRNYERTKIKALESSYNIKNEADSLERFYLEKNMNINDEK